LLLRLPALADFAVHAACCGCSCPDAPPSGRQIVFSTELGLAIEKLPEGVTCKSLWSIV